MSDLADVFSDEPTEAAVEVEESEKVDNEAEPTSEEQSTEEKQPKAEEPEESDFSTREKAYLAQAKDERQKRQEREARIQELEAKLAEFEKPKDESAPDVFEDQEGYTNHLRTEFQQQLSKAKLDIAREIMMDTHSDYAEVEQYVLEQLPKNPALKAELQQSTNVAKAVYEYGKKMQKFQEMKEFNPDEFEAKVRAKVEAEMKAKYEQQAQEAEKAASLSPSLANARGSNVAEQKEIQDISDVF